MCKAITETGAIQRKGHLLICRKDIPWLKLEVGRNFRAPLSRLYLFCPRTLGWPGQTFRTVSQTAFCKKLLSACRLSAFEFILLLTSLSVSVQAAMPFFFFSCDVFGGRLRQPSETDGDKSRFATASYPPSPLAQAQRLEGRRRFRLNASKLKHR